MAAISSLLARLGFVRIGKYGLLLTPDGRILSTRPAVLDDGLGGKIVGWDEGDLAAMELERWQPAGIARPATQKGPPLPPRPPMPRPTAMLPPVVQAPVFAPAPAPVPAPAAIQVAPAPAPEEDEWEWEIAVARARAAADPIPADNWPKTEELHEKIESWELAPAPRHLVMPHQRVAHVPARATGKTIIPVPALPPASETTQVRPVVALRTKPEPLAARPALAKALSRPVPKPEPPVVAEQPRRFPRATATTSSRHEETIRTHAAPPANDDRTSPSITLPPSHVASSVRRVAAKQR